MKGVEVSLLAASGSFNGRMIRGALEETHISWVILASRFAFKIKKPLKLSFLDFSTLAKRKRYCEREVRLNRRFSGIYLGVVPVRHFEGSFTFGGHVGDIVDYAVQMKRMRSSLRMDSMLREQKVRRAHILSLSRCVASFHRRASIISVPFDVVFLKKAFGDIRAVNAFIQKRLGRRYSNIVTKSVSWSNSFLRAHAKRFHERVMLGYKRDVHGDLHSGNIFLYSRPIIFDCIEFNDDYRQIDVIDEIAFFCMDLEVSGKKGLSDLFVRDYSRRFPCFASKEDEEIFRYFKCYRANVRAKVKCLAAIRAGDAADEHDLNDIRKYLRLMEEYMS